MHDHLSHLGPRAALVTFLAGLVGPLMESWVTRSLVSALIGLLVLLLGEVLRPRAARLGRRLAGERPSDPPPPSAPPPASH